MSNKKIIPIKTKTNTSQKEMNESNEEGLFGSFKQSIKYLFQSAKGKYSIETYLSILSEFTDTTIISSEAEGLKFVGGEAKFHMLHGAKLIDVIIELEFKTSSGDWKLKKAERKIECNKFTYEALNTIENAGELKFSVEEPNRR
jgi:hypothetical protein